MRVMLRGVPGPRTCSWRLEGALRRPGPGCASSNRQRAQPPSPGGPGQLGSESPPWTEKAEPKEGRPPRSWAARGAALTHGSFQQRRGQTAAAPDSPTAQRPRPQQGRPRWTLPPRCPRGHTGCGHHTARQRGVTASPRGCNQGLHETRERSGL